MQTIFVQLKCELGKAYEVAAELMERDAENRYLSSNIVYELKTPFCDGTTHVLFEPLDFISRLAHWFQSRR